MELTLPWTPPGMARGTKDAGDLVCKLDVDLLFGKEDFTLRDAAWLWTQGDHLWAGLFTSTEVAVDAKGYTNKNRCFLIAVSIIMRNKTKPWILLAI